MTLATGTRLGPHEVISLVGAGGMGEVYRARDTRLDRIVALKVLPSGLAADPTRRQRFEREARVIASISHPHICALYDVGHQDGLDFLVMEYLDGETLATRLERGPMAVDEALSLTSPLLSALEAIHKRGILHRDLKPQNVFVTPHGLKLLDFGLAQLRVMDVAATSPALTQQGVLLGTPNYMAPEQVRGEALDARADIFAASAIVYEMLAGRPAFSGPTLVEVLYAITHLDPAPLEGAPPIPAIGGVLRGGLAKERKERPPTASALAEALRAAAGSGMLPIVVAPRQRVTRLVALPLRVLRSDAETDFLAESLPEAVSASLSSLDNVLVRSGLSVAVSSGTPLDLKHLAASANVDAVLTGTLLRAGDQVRVSAQLVEVPAGTLLWSQTIQAPVQDLFQLHDALTTAIVRSLELPLTASERRQLALDAPANPRAYELYLRGNQLMLETARLPEVLELYQQAVALDPNYAPAWARLGRVLRVMAKFGGKGSERRLPEAEAAFQRALSLNPDLAIAHHVYAYLEVELGRADEATARLLRRARSHPNEPELFAGLVTTCRYSGLLDASVQAHTVARTLDPAVPTSVAYTWLCLGEFRRAIETDLGDARYAAQQAKYRLGQRAEAIEGLRAIERRSPLAAARLVARTYLQAMEKQNLADLEAGLRELKDSGFNDPEGFFTVASLLPEAGLPDLALELLAGIVDQGYTCSPTLERDPLWDPVRDRSEFREILARANARRDAALAMFLREGGPEVLAVPRSAS